MENRPRHDNSRIMLALIIIVIGMLWLIRKLGIHYHLPDLHLDNVFYPFRQVFHGIGHLFSWPLILIIIGLVLMAGKRPAGLVLLIIGAVFILPRIFFFPGFTLGIFLPVLLIGLGVAMVARLL